MLGQVLQQAALLRASSSRYQNGLGSHMGCVTSVLET